MKIISALVAAIGVVAAACLCVGGFSWLAENNNFQNPANWFLAAIALLLLSKAIQSALEPE